MEDKTEEFYQEELKKSQEITVYMDENSQKQVTSKYYYVCDKIIESKATGLVKYIHFKEKQR